MMSLVVFVGKNNCKMFAGIFLFSIFCAGEVAGTAATVHKPDILISSDSSYQLLKALTPPPANVAEATDDVNLMPPLIPLQRPNCPTLLRPTSSIIPIASVSPTNSSGSNLNKRASIRLAARIYKKRDLFANAKPNKLSQEQSQQEQLHQEQSQHEQLLQEQSQQDQPEQKQSQQEQLQQDQPQLHKSQLQKQPELLELQFFCNTCPKSYRNFGSLQRHQRIECNKDPQHPCTICGTSFYYPRTLRMHIERVHCRQLQ